MVVESLVLGAYKDLSIDPESFKVGQKELEERIQYMVTEKAEAMGMETGSNTVVVLDDDTARGLFIEGIETLEALEVYVSKILLQENIINTVMRHVLDNVTITYNEEAVAQELEGLMASVEQQAKDLGFTLEFYCTYNSMGSIEALKTMYAEEVRTSYLEIQTLQRIAQKEGLTIDQATYEEEKKAYQEKNEGKPFDEDGFRRGLICQKTVNWLVSVNV